MLMLRSTFFVMLVGLGRCVRLFDNLICSVSGGTAGNACFRVADEDLFQGILYRGTRLQHRRLSNKLRLWTQRKRPFGPASARGSAAGKLIVQDFAQPSTDFHRGRLRIRLTLFSDKIIFTPD
jgi:hypothetical protein